MSNPTNERDEANQELPGDGSPNVPDQELPEVDEDSGKPESPGKSDEDHGNSEEAHENAPGQQKKAQPKG